MENSVPREFQVALDNAREMLPEEIERLMKSTAAEVIERVQRKQTEALVTLKSAPVGRREIGFVFYPVASLLSGIWREFSLNEKPSNDPMFQAFLELVEEVIRQTSAALEKRKRGAQPHAQTFEGGPRPGKGTEGLFGGIRITVGEQEITNPEDLPPGIRIRNIRGDTRRAGATVLDEEKPTGDTKLADIKRVAHMDKDQLETYILSFEKGEIPDVMQLAIQKRIKQLKSEGQIEKLEALGLMANLDNRID